MMGGFGAFGGVAGSAAPDSKKDPFFDPLMSRFSGGGVAAPQQATGAHNDRYGGTGPLSDPAPTWGQSGSGPLDYGGSVGGGGMTGRPTPESTGYLPPVSYVGNFWGGGRGQGYGRGQGWDAGWGGGRGQAPNQSYRAEPERQRSYDPSPYPGYAYDSSGRLIPWTVPRDEGQFSRPRMDRIESNFRS